MARESEEIQDAISQILFYMRGGYSRDQAWASSPKERESALKLISENIERTTKTGIAMH
jgi:hypothetical protein